MLATRVERMQGRGGGRVPQERGGSVTLSRRDLHRACPVQDTLQLQRLAERAERGQLSAVEREVLAERFRANAARIAASRSLQAGQ